MEAMGKLKLEMNKGSWLTLMLHPLYFAMQKQLSVFQQVELLPERDLDNDGTKISVSMCQIVDSCYILNCFPLFYSL